MEQTKSANPLSDDQVWGSTAEAHPVEKEPECPLATSAGGCPPDCFFCDDHPAVVQQTCRICGSTEGVERVLCRACREAIDAYGDNQ